MNHATGEKRYSISRGLLSDEGDYRNGAPENRCWEDIEEAEALRIAASAE
jgi:hypothetical protein